MTHSRISPFISRAIAISVLLVIATSPSVAQKKKKGAAQEVDTVALFRGVAVSADAVGLVQLAVSGYGQCEAALRVNIKDKYFPIVELGYGLADATDFTTSMTYKTKAPYARLGLDFNLLRNKHDIYRAYAGVRYGLTYYKFDVKGEGITDPVWGDDVPFSVTGVSANCHWMEGVFGVDAKIVGPLRLGWSVRYRFRIAHNDGSVGNTWYVPGYGKKGGTRLGGTFNIIFEI